MNPALIYRAASVVEPRPHAPFEGTFEEAVDTMVAYAYGIAEEERGLAQIELASQLRHSDPDRVAEVCAAALLRLAKGEADAR